MTRSILLLALAGLVSACGQAGSTAQSGATGGQGLDTRTTTTTGRTREGTISAEQGVVIDMPAFPLAIEALRQNLSPEIDGEAYGSLACVVATNNVTLATRLLLLTSNLGHKHRAERAAYADPDTLAKAVMSRAHTFFAQLDTLSDTALTDPPDTFLTALLQLHMLLKYDVRAKGARRAQVDAAFQRLIEEARAGGDTKLPKTLEATLEEEEALTALVAAVKTHGEPLIKLARPALQLQEEDFINAIKVAVESDADAWTPVLADIYAENARRIDTWEKEKQAASEEERLQIKFILGRPSEDHGVIEKAMEMTSVMVNADASEREHACAAYAGTRTAKPLAGWPINALKNSDKVKEYMQAVLAAAIANNDILTLLVAELAQSPQRSPEVLVETLKHAFSASVPDWMARYRAEQDKPRRFSRDLTGSGPAPVHFTTSDGWDYQQGHAGTLLTYNGVPWYGQGYFSGKRYMLQATHRRATRMARTRDVRDETITTTRVGADTGARLPQ